MILREETHKNKATNRNNKMDWGETFAKPKSASFTDPFTSTNILAHLISLFKKNQNKKMIICREGEGEKSKS